MGVDIELDPPVTHPHPRSDLASSRRVGFGGAHAHPQAPGAVVDRDHALPHARGPPLDLPGGDGLALLRDPLLEVQPLLVAPLDRGPDRGSPLAGVGHGGSDDRPVAVGVDFPSADFVPGGIAQGGGAVPSPRQVQHEAGTVGGARIEGADVGAARVRDEGGLAFEEARDVVGEVPLHLGQEGLRRRVLA